MSRPSQDSEYVAAATPAAAASAAAPFGRLHARRGSPTRTRRLLGVAAAAALSAAVMATTGATALAAATGCPNEAIRHQQASTFLPDCRAYEMVSPPGSIPTTGQGQAATDGERFAYKSWYPYPGERNSGNYLLSTRSAAGWSTEDVIPPQGGVRSSDNFNCTASMFFGEELSTGVLSDGWQEEKGSGEEGNYCEGDVPALVADEPRGVANLFLRDNLTGAVQLLDAPPAETAAANARLEDATPDSSHVLFTERARLTSQAPEGAEDLYEWANGTIRFVTVLPNKTPVPGELADGEHQAEGYYSSTTANQAAYFRHAVSEDGERVVFYGKDRLYVRVNAMQEPANDGECTRAEPDKACTIELDRALFRALGPSGGGVFVAATASGSRVYFLDENRLTTDANTKFGRPDLYEYNLETRKLTDLTADSSEAANARGVVGLSQDGAYLYFVAGGDLTGAQQNSEGAEAAAGSPNLYLLHDGTTTFVATLGEGDQEDWSEEAYRPVLTGKPNQNAPSGAVSPNGGYVAFESSQPLTGYDECTGAHCQQIYLYSAATGKLSCASCPAHGQSTSGGASLAAPWGPLWTGGPRLQPRSLTDEGAVFFDTSEPLVPAATNGAVNVYEFAGQQLSLISSGTAEGNSSFLDASADGRNVFFTTAQGLVASDTDNMLSVYDARVNGGFAATSGEAGQAGPCEATAACRPPRTEPPAEAFGASSAFNGPGDLATGQATGKAPPPAGVHSKAKHRRRQGLTRKQKLRRGLRRCNRRPKHERGKCRRRARARYSGRGRHGGARDGQKRGGRR